MTIAYALIVGFVADLLLGDPRRLPHPVVAIGRGISFLEPRLRALFPVSARGETAGGAAMVVLIAAGSFGIAAGVVRLASALHPAAGFFVECAMCWQALAAKSLRDAGLAVYRELAAGDVDAARRAVSHIVGRDTDSLDADGVARAAVETVAENASDGVVAPMLFFALGGGPLAILYKAINTMDSMLGYKNDRYLHFGKVAARLDDAANFLPARLTALLMVPAALFAGLDWRNAWRIWRRDGNRHASPNAGHPEAACAGALGIRLGGESSYGGTIVPKPAIGDLVRGIAPDDIVRTGRLLYWTAFLALAICVCGRLALVAAWETARWN